MRSSTTDALLAKGIPLDLIKEIEGNSHTVQNLAAMSKKQLIHVYGKSKGEFLSESIKRKPIPPDTVDRIVDLSAESCCFCRDGVSRPYQIHHINLYSQSQDHSLSNLALVCPTHHSTIHQYNIPVEEQLLVRDGWYAIVRIAAAFKLAGLSYPYATFEPMLYTSAPNPCGVLQGREPSAATCKVLARHRLGERGKEQLETVGAVLLIGNSGDGKSTLATGLAGILSAEIAMRYRASPSVSNRHALREILDFIQVSPSGVVLVIDDMSNWATAADLDTVLSAASPAKPVIIVWSEEAKEGAGTAAPHGLSVALHVSWHALNTSILTFIRDNEHVISECINRTTPSLRPRYGHGTFDRSLYSAAKAYAQEALSVWQFVFLMRGGWQTIADDLAQLAPKLDYLPLLCVAIEQIAGNEQPLSTTEAARRCQPEIPKLSHDQATQWVEELFGRLLRERKLIRAYHGYLTPHRQWAKALIIAALEDSSCAGPTSNLLQRELDRNVSQPRRVALLISWLSGDAAGSRFLGKWLSAQEYDSWQRIVTSSISDGLITTSLLFDQLHRRTINGKQEPAWSLKLTDSISDNIADVVGLILAAPADDWYYIHTLIRALTGWRPDFVHQILRRWPPERAADLLTKASPQSFESINWFLSIAHREEKNWCTTMGNAVDWGALFQHVATAIEPGDVESIEELADITALLGLPLRREEVRGFALCLHAALRNAVPSQLRTVPAAFTMLALELLPKFSVPIAQGLDAAKWARDLETSDPRCWRATMMVCGFLTRCGSSFPRNFADTVDPARLTENVRAKAPDPIALLNLLSLLAPASASNRVELASQLQLYIKGAVHSDHRILTQLNRLDPVMATKLASETGVVAPEDADGDVLFRPLLDGLSAQMRAILVGIETADDETDLRVLLASIPDPDPDPDPE